MCIKHWVVKKMSDVWHLSTAVLMCVAQSSNMHFFTGINIHMRHPAEKHLQKTSMSFQKGTPPCGFFTLDMKLPTEYDRGNHVRHIVQPSLKMDASVAEHWLLVFPHWRASWHRLSEKTWPKPTTWSYVCILKWYNNTKITTVTVWKSVSDHFKGSQFGLFMHHVSI